MREPFFTCDGTAWNGEVIHSTVKDIYRCFFICALMIYLKEGKICRTSTSHWRLRMSYADRVNYAKLSPRILDSISSLEHSKNTLLKNNDQALLFDKYEEDHKVYWVVVNYRTPEISIECDTGDEALEALKWFRDNGYKSVSFTDSEYSSSRTYSLESTDKDSDLKINLQCRFDNGTCQFVSEPTGEFEDVAEQVAVPAHKRQIMKKVLKCGSTEIPSVV